MADEETFEERTGVVIVALPAASDPIVAASSEDIPHITMVWLGDAADLGVDVDEIMAELDQWSAEIDGPLTEAVSGTATLGEDQASVVLVDAKALAEIRNGMIAGAMIGRRYGEVEQFPTWIPHVTLGYPETPPRAEYAGTEITFDRLALWVGNDRTEYPMGAAVTAAAEPVAVAEAEEDLITEDDLDDVPEGDVNIEVEIPFHGVAVPIGVGTGDKRQLGMPDGSGASWRPLPFTFFDAHDGPELGTVEKMWVDDENLLRYSGKFRSVMDEPRVSNAIARIVDGSCRGVSVDIDDMVMAIPDEQPVYANEKEALDGILNPPDSVVESFRVSGLSMVPIPAYVESYIALGEEDCTECADEETDVPADELPADAVAASAEQFAPGTKDGPGWVTNPVATSRIRRYWVSGKGAGKIRWGAPGDFNRCRTQLAKYVQNPDWLAGLCANLHKEALGVWPGQEGGRGLVASAEGVEVAPPFYLVASADVEDDYVAPPAAWFQPQKFDRIMPTQITKDGHIFGHLAQWGVCHIGITGVCTTPPVSPTDYAYFHTGMLETAEGDDVSVGHFAHGIGHAGLKASAAAATAHYDRDDSAFCDVVVWEDEHGIAFSGAVRKHSVAASKIRDIRASGSFSGDWRTVGGQLELVAAVAVGTPGFPVPALSLAASGQHQTALIASGIVEHKPSDGGVIPPGAMDAAALRNAVSDELNRRKQAEIIKLQVATKLRLFRIERAKGRI